MGVVSDEPDDDGELSYAEVPLAHMKGSGLPVFCVSDLVKYVAMRERKKLGDDWLIRELKLENITQLLQKEKDLNASLVSQG